MKITYKFIILMLILSFGFLSSMSISQADWWERGDRPVLPRDGFEMPTQPPQPTNPPGNQPTSTPPPQGGPEVSVTPDPGDPGDDNNDDPCADGKSYTGDYCGWSPRIGGDSGNSGDPGDPGDPPVDGLSYTGGESISISDIMLLSGVLCLLLYAKSKFAPNADLGIQGKRRSR